MTSGRVIWRFGGRNNQFTILNDPLNGFGSSHDVHVLPNGHLLFFDNGKVHNPGQSRAVEYVLDPLAFTATMVWEYRHNPSIFAPILGSVERLGGGNTVIGFGAAGTVTEVSASGNVVWEGNLSARTFYRVRRVPSLYGYLRP